MLSQEQINNYYKDGFLTVENVIRDDELQQLCTVTDEFVEKSRAITHNDAIYDLEPDHSADNPRLRRLKNPIQHHEIYHKMINHDAIINIVEQLIGKGVRTNGNKLNMKPPSHGSAVEWHQDWAFYPHTNDDLLAVGIAIDDMTETNGCMLMVPGSHKTELISHHENGVFVGAVADPNFKADNTAQVLVKAGGISIHHARTLHASTPNHSDKPRRLLLFQYCAIDSWPLSGFDDYDAYLQSIIRGEPTITPRMENVPVIIPLPKPNNAGSIFEIQDALSNKEMANQ